MSFSDSNHTAVTAIIYKLVILELFRQSITISKISEVDADRK